MKEEIDKIVILDDNDEGISKFFEEKFILVNRFFGLNNSVYQKALEILMFLLNNDFNRINSLENVEIKKI